MRAAGLSAPRPAARAGETLTETEERLVRLVCDGLTNRQIAAALHYSPKTVEVYLSRIYAKTKCASRVELVRALEGGAVDLPVGRRTSHAAAGRCASDEARRPAHEGPPRPPGVAQMPMID